MLIQVDGETVLELSATDIKILKYQISRDIFTSDIKRRQAYVIQEKLDFSTIRLMNDYLDILKATGQVIPTDPAAIAEMIFLLPEYKDRFDSAEAAYLLIQPA